MEEEHAYTTVYNNCWSPQEQEIIDGLKEIYQEALIKFPTNENLIKRYNEFLEGINDQMNQRSLLNLALDLFPENHEFVWNLYQQFEKKCGTMDSIMEFEEKHLCDNINHQNSADAKFSFVWVKDLFTFYDKKPYSEQNDMEYTSMAQYYSGPQQYDLQLERMNMNSDDEYDKLTQFKNILPMNYQGKTKVDIDLLISILENTNDSFF